MQVENKRKNIKIGSFLIIIVLCYLFLFFRWVYGNNIATDIIRNDTLEDSISAEALIIRDEEVLKSPINGKCINEVTEGEKIPANYRIATVLSDSSEKLLEALKDIDLRIIKAQKEKSENQDFFSEDVVKIENDIQQRIKLLIIESNANSLDKTKNLREDIDALIQKKASIVGSKSTSDVFLNDLKKQKQNIQDQINSNTREITSQTSGVISYTTDGYEDKLNPKSIKSITPNILEGIKYIGKSKIETNKNVEAAKPFAKVIKGFDYYILIPVDTKNIKDIKVNSNISVRINEISKVVSGEIINISNDIDGKSVVSVKIDKIMSETAGLRKISIDLLKSSYTGLKVPLKSLIQFDELNMKAKIVLVKANYASIREIKITGKNQESAVIQSADDSDNTISLYDTFVVNPENIKEGQLISQ